MKRLEFIPTVHLFGGLHGQLMGLLGSLAPQDWDRSTLAGAWRVRDVVAHLLDGQIRRLSFQRDHLQATAAGGQVMEYTGLVSFLNDLNAEWIRAARRISPRLLIDFLQVTGPQVAALFASLDPHAPALFPVAWAGESKSENWFDIGREYTEQWHHQAQVREAVGAPLLLDRDWLRPVLELSMKAFCRVFAGVSASPGTAVVVVVSGDAGGTWSVVMGTEGWSIFEGEHPAPAARARCDADAAWRLFFNALPEPEARQRIVTEGEAALLDRLFAGRGVMV